MSNEPRLKPRVVACKDCGVGLVYSGRGRPPERCPECFIEHMRQRQRERDRRKAASKREGVPDCEAES